MRVRSVLAAVAAALVLAGCTGNEPPAFPGGIPSLRQVEFDVDSELVGERLEQVGIGPVDRNQPLLLFLHGRGGSPEATMEGLDAAGTLAALGEDAPAVVFVNGGSGGTYFHDRATGDWGSYVVEEVLPQAIEVMSADPGRVAIGGISMGGFGALDIARLWPDRFCAAGAHSPAIWRSFEDTREGAFDDAADFEAHDLLAEAQARPDVYGDTPVWIDVGEADPFRPTASTLAGYLASGDGDVRFEVRPGGHDAGYWSGNFPDYAAFYAEALAEC